MVAVELAQAELAMRRAAADETQAQTKGYRDTIATLTARQAALATERSRMADAAIEALAVSQGEGLVRAQRCVADEMAGLWNYTSELPEVQDLFRQLVDAIEQLQPAQKGASAPLAQDPRQSTLLTCLHGARLQWRPFNHFWRCTALRLWPTRFRPTTFLDLNRQVGD